MKEADTNGTERKAETDFEGTIRNRERCRNYKRGKGNVIPFIIKRLSMKEIKEIRNNYKTKEVYRDKRNGDRPIIGNNGQVAVINDYDGDSAGLEIMVEVHPGLLKV